MTAHDQSVYFRNRAIQFYARARHYEQTGELWNARDFRDAARAFQNASEWLDRPWIRDLPFDETAPIPTAGEGCGQ